MATKGKSSSHYWKGDWKPDQWQTGPGIVGEGKLTALRFHTEQSKSDITRYTVITVQISAAFKRTTDSYGSEVVPDFTGKKPNAANAHKVTHDELAKLFAQSPTATVPLLPGLDLEAQYLNAVHPKTVGSFDLWGDIDYMNKVTLKEGDPVRFFTKGNSFFISKVQNAALTFEGRDDAKLLNQIVGRSDTYVDDEEEAPAATGGGDVADDEWD